MPAHRKRALLLQGGGCRTFFTLGVLEVAGDVLGPFDEIGAVSASTAMACAHALGIHGEAYGLFARRVRGNPRNFYPRQLLRGRRPTPHLAMFRDAVLECVSPARFAMLCQSPTRLRFLVGVGPLRSPMLTVLLAAATGITKRPTRFIDTHVVNVRDLSGPEELVSAILASSAFPPFTPLPRIGGRPGIDGGVVESVPLRLASPHAERVAILTRPTPWRPLPPSVRVIAPRSPLPVSIWDYASEPRIQATFDAGRRRGDELNSAPGDLYRDLPWYDHARPTSRGKHA